MPKRKGINGDRAFKFADGKLYLRRAKATPNFLESVAKKIRTGEYVHEETTDDVETYVIAEWSPMFRGKQKLGEMPLRQVETEIIRFACSRDFKGYRDACGELARRYKGGEVTTGTGEPLDLASALQAYQRAMLYLEQRIVRRGGPTGVEIQMRLRDLETAKRGRKIITGAVRRNLQ
jgi:hypothetical protein